MSDTSQQILLVEDDDAIREELVGALGNSGFSVTSAATFGAAASLLDEPFSLVLLDRWLPDGDGLDLCGRLRSESNQVPVIVLTARDQPEEIVRGLDIGADDYITKPFRLPELLARIRSVLRRTAPPTRSDLAIGPLAADILARRASLGGVSLKLKPREFELLTFFMRHPGRAWTRKQLLERVWGDGYAGDDRTVDLHVARLRSTIEENPRDPQWIQTVWRVGYRFREDAP